MDSAHHGPRSFWAPDATGQSNFWTQMVQKTHNSRQHKKDDRPVMAKDACLANRERPKCYFLKWMGEILFPVSRFLREQEKKM